MLCVFGYMNKEFYERRVIKVSSGIIENFRLFSGLRDFKVVLILFVIIWILSLLVSRLIGFG